ncbi:MAG: hypothetical protein RQ899_02530 [Pseudomonadales bacterium]|nr:hypothetical protein [Pseudomonadales bacterium]
MMRTTAIAGLAALLASMPLAAQDAAPGEDARVKVEVSFSPALERRLNVSNRLEQSRERDFREQGYYGNSRRRAGVFRFAANQTPNLKWAGEFLIPAVEDYSFENLLSSLTLDNLKRAAPDFAGTIHYEINNLKISNYSISFIQGRSSYVIGYINVLAPDGSLLQSEKITANLVVDFSVDWDYQGPKYAFMQTDDDLRVGPMFSYFVEKALERVWPEQSKVIQGPVMIQISGPDETVISS